MTNLVSEYNNVDWSCKAYIINMMHGFCICLDGLLKIYFFVCGSTIIYYLSLMNSMLSDFDNKIVAMSSIGSCLFKDVCFNFNLGRDLCGNCYNSWNSSILF